MNIREKISNCIRQKKLHKRLAELSEDDVLLQFSDCDTIASRVESEMKRLNIPHKRISIVSEPQKDLGHACLKNQTGHEVVEAFGIIYDLHFPELLPLEKYLKKAYAPKSDVRLIAAYH